MDLNYQLRRMTRKDLEQVLALEQRCHAQPWSRATFEQELANEVARIDLLLIDDVVAGYISSWQVAGELEIQNIVTAPEWRRRGVARVLLRRLLSRAAAGQVERILLEVRAGNVAAIALYERFGFCIDARRENYYADGEAAVLMSLDGLSGTELPVDPRSRSGEEMKNFRTIVLSNQEISPGYFRMRILAPGISKQVKPGQFLMFRVQLSLPPLLRRPFGIFQTGFLAPDCDGLPPREYLEMVYKVVGGGTRFMSELHSGDRVEILGPLGRGFDTDVPGREKILVGGGIGLVPLFMLARELLQKNSVRLLMGGRTRQDIIAVTEFERLGVETYVSTEDGSLGEEGLITQVLERKLAKYPEAAVYACGPMPMLEAVQRICARYRVPLQVSLEALMACGVGACLGCVVKGAGHTETTPSFLCTCKAGPVFKSEQLDWQQMQENDGYCEGCKS